METIIAIIALILGAVIGIVLGKRMAAGEIAGKDRIITEKDTLIAEKDRQIEEKALLAAEREQAAERMQKMERQRAEEILAERDHNAARMLEEHDKNANKILEERESANRAAVEAMQVRFDETIAKMQEQLKNLTQEMLRDREQEFARTSKEGIGRIVEPLEQSIKAMREAVADNSSRHDKLSGEMNRNISELLQHSDAARRSADKLADALTHNSRVQGAWGETILTELLESQGLSEGIHFDTQQTIRDAAGNIVTNERNSSMRPDVILHLDKTRDVIIDSKVSLSAYLDYVNATTDEARSAALRAHVDSVRKHVKELAAKDYTAYIKPPKQKMDYVIMFMPCTPALYAATSADPDLWRRAMESNVYIADEQTLYAALKIISMTWTQIAQAENHEKVYALADEMLQRVEIFMEKYTNIGKKLDDARKAYDEGMDKLRDRGTSIPVTCRKLIKLGAKPKNKGKVDPALIGYEAGVE